MLVKAVGLEKKFDDFKIKYKDMQFETGKKYLILGASGCGKSTYLNMVAGLIEPTKGSIIVDDVDITKLGTKASEQYRLNKIGYIYQDFKLLEDLTVEDNIKILNIEKKMPMDIPAVLEEVKLGNKRKQICRKLSGGEKQRVAIARALVKKPSILLADEPTGNLNFATGIGIVEALCNVKDCILIAVTHDTRLTDYFDEVIDFSEIAESISLGDDKIG